MDGSDDLPDDFGRLAQARSSEKNETLAEVVRSIYGSGMWADEPAYLARTDRNLERVYAHGVTRVLDVLDSGNHPSRLVVGTPLFVEYTARPMAPRPAWPGSGFWRRWLEGRAVPAQDPDLDLRVKRRSER